MKHLFTAVAVLLSLTAVSPAFAIDGRDRDARVDVRERTNVIDDVIRMSQAGVSDAAILGQLRDSRERYVVDADAVIALTNAHVSKAVLDAVMDNADRRDDGRDARRDDRRTTTTVYVAPSYTYDPWYRPYSYYPYIYSPYWYAPRLSIGFGFGFGGRSYGHFGGGRGGRGGRH